MREQPRLHPESWRELRQLYKLHGANALKNAIDWMLDKEAEERHAYLIEVERQENEARRQKDEALFREYQGILHPEKESPR